jgi:hypothetical protein
MLHHDLYPSPVSSPSLFFSLVPFSSFRSFKFSFFSQTFPLLPSFTVLRKVKLSGSLIAHTKLVNLLIRWAPLK